MLNDLQEMSLKRKRPYKKRYYYGGKRCSKGEFHIAKLLEFNGIPFIQEKTFESCRSPKNNLLRFDFYLTDHNILIEFQGQHHYKPVNKYKRALRVYKQTIIHDAIKRDFAVKNKVKLIEIHHKDINKLESLIILS